MISSCAVPLETWMIFCGQRDAVLKQEPADDHLRGLLLEATGGNCRNAKLDVTPVKVVLASGVSMDHVLSTIRAKHDKKSFPGA
jgi:hypothetical protein